MGVSVAAATTGAALECIGRLARRDIISVAPNCSPSHAEHTGEMGQRYGASMPNPATVRLALLLFLGLCRKILNGSHEHVSLPLIARSMSSPRRAT